MTAGDSSFSKFDKHLHYLVKRVMLCVLNSMCESISGVGKVGNEAYESVSVLIGGLWRLD